MILQDVTVRAMPEIKTKQSSLQFKKHAAENI